MSFRTKNILVFILMLILVGLVVAWFTILNKGLIVANTGLTNYNLVINNATYECTEDPCTLEHKTGSYLGRFEKDEYNVSSFNVAVLRGQKTEITLSPKKIVNLEVSETYNESTKPKIQVPFGVDAESIIASSWNTDNSKFLYLDIKDGKLKITDKSGEEKIITILKDIPKTLKLFWSEDESKIIGAQENDIYFIEVEIGSRKKNSLDFNPNNILMHKEGDYILLNQEDKLLKIDWDSMYEIKDLEIELDLAKSIWIDMDTIITYELDEEVNKTTIWAFTPNEKVSQTITEKFDFPITDIKFNNETQTVYVLNSKDNEWYEIKM